MRVLLGFLGALGLFAAFPAVAAPEAGKVFGDWAVDCEKTPDGKEQRCFLSQSQVMKENNARLLKVSVGYLGPKGEPMVVAVLPLGIDLRAGAALKVDERKQVGLIMQNCQQDGCLATAVLPNDELKALAQAKGAQVGVLPYGGRQTVVITVSPKGLKDGLNVLK